MKKMLTVLVAVIALGLGALLGYWISGGSGDNSSDGIEQDVIEQSIIERQDAVEQKSP